MQQQLLKELRPASRYHPAVPAEQWHASENTQRSLLKQGHPHRPCRYRSPNYFEALEAVALICTTVLPVDRTHLSPSMKGHTPQEGVKTPRWVDELNPGLHALGGHRGVPVSGTDRTHKAMRDAHRSG